MKTSKIVTAIVAAALVGGITEATKFFPNLAEIFVASNVLVSAIAAYILGKDTEV